MRMRPAMSLTAIPAMALLFALGMVVLDADGNGGTAQAGAKTLDVEEADKLIRGNTLVGFTPKDQSEYTAFYSSSGQVRALIVNHDKRRSVIGKWWINGEGKLCNEWETFGYVSACHGVGFDSETVTFIDESGRIVSFAELHLGNSEGL